MASTKLTRTPSTTTAVDAWTFSVWLKRSSITPVGSHDICSGRNNTDGGNNQSTFSFDANDNLYFDVYNGGIIVVKFITNRKFRDLNAWYHIVLDFDSSTAGARSAADRMKVWVNGIRETSFSTEVQSGADQETNFCQQNDCPIAIGANAGLRTATYNGLMSHINYVAGVGHPASYFGETDATTGIWKPNTSPSVTYGTNGFFLKFENSGTMGLDSSINTNNFTVSGTLTQTVDTPSNVFATLNPLQQNNSATTYSNGNTKGTGTSSVTNFSSTPATLGASSGKFYAEYKPNLSSTSSSISGFVNLDTANFNVTDFYGGSNNMSAGLYDNSGQILYSTGTNLGSVGALSNGDIVMLAMDLDNGYLYWGKNGTWFNSADPTSASGTGGLAISNLGSNGTYTFLNSNRESMGTEWNFGNGYFGTTAVSSATTDESGLGIFEYTVPSGYYALCTKNINEQEYD
jgi:hypothetical protein